MSSIPTFFAFQPTSSPQSQANFKPKSISCLSPRYVPEYSCPTDDEVAVMDCASEQKSWTPWTPWTRWTRWTHVHFTLHLIKILGAGSFKVLSISCLPVP